MSAMCEPCKRRGRLAVGNHWVAGESMCNDCFSGKEKPAAPLNIPAPKLIAKRETKMPNVKKFNVAEMQADRDTGMRPADIAKKHGCSDFTVYSRTKSNGRKPAGGGGCEKHRLPKELAA